MFHNAHLKPPYTDPRRIEPTYRMGLEHHAPVVFLTARQRADAELVYGEHPNYFVIPNAAPSAAPEPSAQRDPRLVVMFGATALRQASRPCDQGVSLASPPASRMRAWKSTETAPRGGSTSGSSTGWASASR